MSGFNEMGLPSRWSSNVVAVVRWLVEHACKRVVHKFDCAESVHCSAAILLVEGTTTLTIAAHPTLTHLIIK